MPSIKKIIASKLFYKLLEKASLLVTKNAKLSKVAIKAIEKVVKTGSIKSLGTTIIKQVKLLSAMTFHYAKGSYRNVNQRSIIKIIAVLLYFIMPFDLVPDFIPGAGYLDDISLIGWLFTIVGKEINQFELWYLDYQKIEVMDYEEIK